MKPSLRSILTTTAVCALLAMNAPAQEKPQPPAELCRTSSVISFAPFAATAESLAPFAATAEGPEPLADGNVLFFSDADAPLTLMAQAQTTAPAPPPGGATGPVWTPGVRVHGPGPHKWWRDSETVKQLQLSDGQAQQIEQAFTDSKLRLIDMMASLQKEELKLGTLINADQPNENAVSNQVDQVVQARGKLEKEHAMMMLGIRRLLTSEQWKKLQSIDGGMGMGMGHRMFVRKFHGPPPQGPPPPDGPQAPE